MTKKNNLTTVVDFGANEIRLAVLDKKYSKLFFKSINVSNKNNYEDHTKSINFLVREAEKKISAHLENISVLYDSSEICTIDLSIKKKLDQKMNFIDICSSLKLEANQLINDCYFDKKVIHIIVNKYIINSREFSSIPKEIPDLNSLIIEMKFICLPYHQYNNINEIFIKNNLKVLNFFLSSLVKSFYYIDHFKKNKNVTFLDIGLNRTTIISLTNKKLIYLNSIPIGGDHITKDISIIMKLSLEEAEELKKSFNKSEIDFSYNESETRSEENIIQKVLGKNISIDLLKKVVLARIEEMIQLSFKNIGTSHNIDKKKSIDLVLIGNGSKLFNRNSLQIEDKYNFKEINFYEENEFEICKAGLEFEKNFENENTIKFVKNRKKLGFFQRFFNIFGNS